jgi:predicted transposase YbfD/YdcC
MLFLPQRIKELKEKKNIFFLNTLVCQSESNTFSQKKQTKKMYFFSC